MEDIIPVLYLAVIVKPVFRKHGQNVIIYDRLHPVIGTSIFRLAAEIAVSDTESFSEGFISPDCSIEFDDLGNEFIEGFVIHCSSIVAEPLGLKSRFEFEKAKPSPQGIINHGQASVCRVHHSDDIKVLRNGKGPAIIGQGRRLTTVVFFNQHQQLPKNLTQIAAVDLINDKEEFFIPLIRGLLTEPVKYTGFQRKTARFIGLVAHHEIFIGITLMELNEFNLTFVLFPHQRICQPLGTECLSDAGRSLQNDVFLIKQHFCQTVIVLLRQIDFRQKIILV